MAACTQEMEKAFHDANSYQRFFWSEQFRSLNVKSSKGMQWQSDAVNTFARSQMLNMRCAIKPDLMNAGIN